MVIRILSKHIWSKSRKHKYWWEVLQYKINSKQLFSYFADDMNVHYTDSIIKLWICFYYLCGCDLLITKMYDSCVPRRWVDVSRTLFFVGLSLCELDLESSVPDRSMSLCRFFLKQKPNTDMFLFKIVRFCFK